jgi:uncharacterized damage-inducible protein DinB
MVGSLLERVLEHNNWANQRLLQTCAALEEALLDAQPQSATVGTIRETLIHLVAAQRGYLSLLTQPIGARSHAPLAFEELSGSAAASGGGLLDLARNADGMLQQRGLPTTDGYHVDAWVVVVQAIQHAAEHREQVCSMLTALGVAPPELDGWAYGEAAGALVER